ncbi:hypothetical protein KCMC57_64150 (plasmid) [Kitasatospora sp. CMC57]|uniref:Uncharacterized protein n=1 Tax=Kitasatospora sp. CMC57 TaxID=3231513 RepID=A0AB33KC32_9ACTN
MSPKKNPSTSAKRARAAQQANPDVRYTALLRADLAAAAGHVVEPAQAPATHTTAPGGTRMSIAWSPTTIVGIDERYDTEYADSRNGSRYAAYVKPSGRCSLPPPPPAPS